eukprot:m.16654 g.16654  ORF g.16654 m.16654 type:complete len:161 (-) comp28546_c0_seq1:1183-1665(-)
MLIICQSGIKHLLCSELHEALCELLGNEVELGIGGVAQAKDSNLCCAQRVEWQLLLQQEPPESPHIGWLIALASCCADEDDVWLVDEVCNVVGIHRKDARAEVAAQGIAHNARRNPLGRASLRAEQHQHFADNNPAATTNNLTKSGVTTPPAPPPTPTPS